MPFWAENSRDKGEGSAAQAVLASAGAVAFPFRFFGAQDTAEGFADEVTRPADRTYATIKRLIDIAVALIGLIVCAPLLLVVAALVMIDSQGPPLHRRHVLARQAYSGDSELVTFTAWKIRTMRSDADAILHRDPELLRRYRSAFKLPDDPRITRFGGWLRRTSIDELPQLWNILTGEMTLAGPRMITAPELALYGDKAARLLSVKPGLTGVWQVCGRSEVAYPIRVRLDMWYIENRCLRLDLRILLRTAACVLSRRGAW